MRRKILLPIAVLIILSMILSGCSKPAVTESPAKESPAKEEKITIANVPKMIGIAWWDRFEEGNKKFVADNSGVEIFQTGSTQPDASQQVRVLEDVIAQKVDAISVIPVDPKSLEPVLKKAMDQGIIVVSHEASNLENVDYDLEAFKNADYGAHLMDSLAELMGGKGEFAIMLGGLTMQTHLEWADGAIARQKEKYPDMKLVTAYVESGAAGQQGAYAKAKELITAYPNLGGFIGMDAVNPPGIALALEESGKAGKIKCVGTSLVSMSKQYLESGSISRITFWDPGLAAQAMAKIITLKKQGKPITDGMDLGVSGYNKVILDGKKIFGAAWVDVTKENMGDYNF